MQLILRHICSSPFSLWGTHSNLRFKIPAYERLWKSFCEIYWQLAKKNQREDRVERSTEARIAELHIGVGVNKFYANWNWCAALCLICFRLPCILIINTRLRSRLFTGALFFFRYVAGHCRMEISRQLRVQARLQFRLAFFPDNISYLYGVKNAVVRKIPYCLVWQFTSGSHVLHSLTDIIFFLYLHFDPPLYIR